MKLAATLMATTVLIAAGTVAQAETLRWARSADSLTLDPHAQNNGVTHTFNHQVYEPLVVRDADGGLRPTLAVEWGITEDDPTIWEFKLREGVTFHDGADFTADDVVFSINRAKADTSNMRELVASIEEVIAVDDYTVHMRTSGPNPLLVDNLTNMFMMDRDWSEANNAAVPQDFDAGEEHYAARNANGTGPYELVSREADARSVLTRFEDYWGRDEFPLDISEIIYTPITSPATRVAALLSGEVDFLQDVPVQDIVRLEQSPGLRVTRGPENRTVFFGLNVARDALEYGQADGNPFSHREVRQAMNIAIDRDAIAQVVMRGESIPLGTIAPPFINGYTEEMGLYPAVDLDEAQALMEQAGYGDGFQVTMHCPNDRYVNDEAICQAVVGMLGRIGIDVALESRSLSLHFPGVSQMETDFFMYGWGVPTFDSQYVFDYLVHTREGGLGSSNSTGYSNPELDAKIQSLASEPDADVRNETIAEIWEVVQEEVIYLPVHNQMLARAMNERFDIPVNPSNDFFAKDVAIE
jgi:peptide/nickel transport system substrate-binding protein